MDLKIVAISLLLLLSSAPFISSGSRSPKPIRKDYAPLVNGLSWDFYDDSCPELELIVRGYLLSVLTADIGLAAGLLRVFFHDCFVQGCDGSVLLTGKDSEQLARPNQSLRPEAFQIINELRDLLQEACGLVVSCADITALAARDSVFLSGGPYLSVPLGRRDSLGPAPPAVVSANIPSPLSNVTKLLTEFATKNLTACDLVALSGAHTIGIGHCGAFANRLFPTQDPTLNPAFAKQLYATCPTSSSPNFTVLDLRTPELFDNRYFVDLVNDEGLFTSDQGLFGDARTRDFVKQFAENQWVFFANFVTGMVKMSQLEVLTGNKGEIRRNCSLPNSAAALFASL